jgi:hypothetical protein
MTKSPFGVSRVMLPKRLLQCRGSGLFDWGKSAAASPGEPISSAPVSFRICFARATHSELSQWTDIRIPPPRIPPSYRLPSYSGFSPYRAARPATRRQRRRHLRRRGRHNRSRCDEGTWSGNPQGTNAGEPSKGTPDRHLSRCASGRPSGALVFFSCAKSLVPWLSGNRTEMSVFRHPATSACAASAICGSDGSYWISGRGRHGFRAVRYAAHFAIRTGGNGRTAKTRQTRSKQS